MNKTDVFLCLAIFALAFMCFAILEAPTWAYVLYTLGAAFIIDNQCGSNKKDGD